MCMCIFSIYVKYLFLVHRVFPGFIILDVRTSDVFFDSHSFFQCKSVNYQWNGRYDAYRWTQFRRCSFICMIKEVLEGEILLNITGFLPFVWILNLVDTDRLFIYKFNAWYIFYKQTRGLEIPVWAILQM